jgi:hypothetical protein
VLSRPDRHRPSRAFVLAWLALLLFIGAASAQDPAPGVSDAEVAAAIETLRADPNLSSEERQRSLRWVESSDVEPSSDAESTSDADLDAGGWLNWMGQLFSWVGQTSRVLVWLVLIVLAGLLGVAIVRVIQNARGSGKRQRRLDVPTHVRELDIRPESLPDDIGAAALAQWEAGEHRAALSLLYRGLLSRLVHVHAVPIRQSTTEGDCLALAARHLRADRTSYVAQLVRIWQRSVYGGHEPGLTDVRALCDGFATALSATSATLPEARG